MADRDREAEVRAGQRWFNSLTTSDKWELGDQLVLGTFEFLDWEEMLPRKQRPPSDPFLEGVEQARMCFEA